MEDKKLIKILIDMLGKYDRYCARNLSKSPEEFIEKNYCESNQKYDKCVSIFFQICSLRKLLNSICEDDRLPKDSCGVVLVYFILFYLTPTSQGAIVESLLDHLKPKTRDSLLRFFSQNKNELLDIITEKGCQVYRMPKRFDYVLKEVKERSELIANLENNLRKRQQCKKLNAINYTIEHADEILGNYSKPMAVDTNGRLSSSKGNFVETNSGLELSFENLADPQLEIHPPFPPNKLKLHRGPVVRKTTAQVLREASRILRDMKSSEKILQDLCVGCQDSERTLKFLEEERVRQQENELRSIERKHLLGLISREEAKLARAAVQRMNQFKANEAKRESHELEVKLAEWRHDQETKLRESAERLNHQCGRCKTAQLDLMKQKQKVAKAMKKESMDLQRRIDDQKRRTLDQKTELIHQIKHLQQVSKNNREMVDNRSLFSIGPTSSMSINQLKEALAEIRRKIQLDIESRRQKIRTEHERHQKLVQDAMDAIESHQRQESLAKRPKSSKQPVKPTPDLVQLRQHLERVKRESAWVRQHA